jgi:hypothetical protein
MVQTEHRRTVLAVVGKLAVVAESAVVEQQLVQPYFWERCAGLHWLVQVAGME